MPQPSSVAQLPTEVRTQLDQRLLASGFSGYTDLTDWLQDQGYEISRSAVGRHASKFKARMERLRETTAMAKEAGALLDDEGAHGATAVALAQSNLIELLFTYQDVTEETDIEKRSKMISQMSKSAAELMRAEVVQQKHKADVRSRAQAAADEIDEVVRKAGLSDDAANQIRAKILGVAS